MLRLYHDYTSPASAVAVLRLARLAADGVAVEHVPLDVLGLDRSVPPTPALLDGLERHRAEMADLGLPPRRPDRQPPTLRAHLLGGLARDRGRGTAWRAACYRAFWRSGADLSDTDRLVALAEEVGLDVDAARRQVTDEEAAGRLRRRMARARREGVGGVPVLEMAGTFVPALLPEDDLRSLAAL